MSPKHPDMGPNGAEPAPPYNLVDNPFSPLDATDLVQVDAMMTGYSRPAPGVKVTDFTGAGNDLKMFGQFIRNYLDKYNRWGSPKFLFGESYGTFRSAGLSSELQSAEGIELNGVMLLGHRAGSRAHSAGAGERHAVRVLPADVHGDGVVSQAAARRRAEALARAGRAAVTDVRVRRLRHALAKGNTLTAAERNAAAQQMARLTGLSPQFILNTNLRIDPGVFRTELLRDQRETVGRYDSRMIGLNGNASSQRQDYDPSDVAPSGAFMSAFMRYLHNDLDYTTDLQYYTGGHAGRWDYSGILAAGNLGSGYPSTSEALRTAMAKNPYLHVMVGAGYYDMATPFANAEYTFHHLGYDKTYADRVQFKYYESGHMAYFNQTSAKQLKADIASFVESTQRPANLTP